MKYGSYIKNIRQILDIKQKDLTNCNLSKNLLSNIEKDKTNLVPQKAIMLFTKAAEISLAKNIYIDLDFDELLSDQKKYQSIKTAYEKCFELKGRIAYKKYIKPEEVSEIHDLVRSNDLGIITFYLYYYAADLFEENSMEKLETYFHGLHYLKWLPMSEYVDLYKKTLSEVRPLAEAYERYQDLYYFYDTLKDAESHFAYRVNPNTFLHLGEYAEKLNRTDKSIFFLNQYQKHIVDQKPESYFEVNEKLAMLYYKKGEVHQAMKLLTKDLDKLIYKKYLNFEIRYRTLIIDYAYKQVAFEKELKSSFKRLLEINELNQNALDFYAFEVLVKQLVRDDYMKLASKILDDAYFTMETSTDKCRVLNLEMNQLSLTTDYLSFVDRAFKLPMNEIKPELGLMYAKVILKAQSYLSKFDGDTKETYYINIENLESSM